MERKGFLEFEWEVRDTKSGIPTLLLGGRSVYSAYDPLKSAHTLAQRLGTQLREEKKDYLIIIGLGLGYLPHALFKLGYKNIIVWEPFPIMQKSFPLYQGKWQKSIKLVFNKEDFERAIQAYVKEKKLSKFIIHPGYNPFCMLEHRIAIQCLDRYYLSAQKDDYIVSQRTLETMERLPFLITIKDFEGVFKGQRAILISPGPSLKKCIPAIKNAQSCIIISTLQAAPFLQQNHIKIDFVVNADPRNMSSFLNDCKKNFKAFITETSSDPETLDWWPENTFLFHFRCRQLHEKLWENAKLPIIEYPIATVSETMLILAEYMEFDEVYCVGMDFCWEEDRYTYRTENIHDITFKDLEKKFLIASNAGKVFSTVSSYFHAIRFIQQRYEDLENDGFKLFQIEGGIEFNSDNLLTLYAFNKKLAENTLKVDYAINHSQTFFNIKNIINELNSLISNNSAKIIKTKDSQTDELVKLMPFLKKLSEEQRDKLCKMLKERLLQIK